MYQVIIDFKKTIPPAQVTKLVKTADKAFDNRAGHTKNVSLNPYRCIYEGEEDLFCCLQLGSVNLSDDKAFKGCVESIIWVDEDPDENCNVLKEVEKYNRTYR